MLEYCKYQTSLPQTAAAAAAAAMAAAPGDRPIDQTLRHAWAQARQAATDEAWRIQAEIMVQEGYPERLARCEMLEKELRRKMEL